MKSNKSKKPNKFNNERVQEWGRVGRSVLNGVLGDYLDKERNPLAIKMGFYHRRRRLQINDRLADQVDFNLTNKLVIFVHGLTNLESVLDFPKPKTDKEDHLESQQVDHYIDSCFEVAGGCNVDNYGYKLQRDFAYTPLFLRYNTGLSVEKNSREFGLLLNDLYASYPLKIDEILLVGFSMGGLLVRQVQTNALEHKSAWLQSLNKCIYIGSPHEGAPLEKFGHLTSEVFGYFPKPYFNLWKDRINVRSEGIKNLRHGLLSQGMSEDVSQEKSLSADGDISDNHGFYSKARHYFIAGALFSESWSGLNYLLGDALVREGSAVPKAAPVNSLSAKFEGLAHIPLAHSEVVYQQIKCWISHDEKKYQEFSRTKEPVVRFEAENKPYTGDDEDDVSSQALLAGTIDLIATGYDKTLETVESMHFSIADEPFNAVGQVPGLGRLSYSVEKAHSTVLKNVYRSLRWGGRAVHEVAKQLAPNDEKDLKRSG